MSVLRHTQEEAGVGGRELRSSGAMLGLHSEPCSTTLRCSRPTTRAVCRRGYGGGFAVVQKPNTNPGGSTG